MKILVIEPKAAPYVKDIDIRDDLTCIVGGYIEAIYPYSDRVAIICNEEGKIRNLPLNRIIKYENYPSADIIAGTFAVVGIDDDGFSGLNEEQIAKYSALFKN